MACIFPHKRENHVVCCRIPPGMRLALPPHTLTTTKAVSYTHLDVYKRQIPGYRPGKPTSDFITKVLGKITFIGAMFLGIVAIFPIEMCIRDRPRRIPPTARLA